MGVDVLFDDVHSDNVPCNGFRCHTSLLDCHKMKVFLHKLFFNGDKIKISDQDVMLA